MRGRVEYLGADHVIVDVGALGVMVYVPQTQLSSYSLGQTLSLFTHLHVREQDITLFGFDSSEELQLFLMLTAVSGVGPRLALNILATLPPDTIRTAVVNEEVGLLTRVPGIGAKSARKILFHLKDKLDISDLESLAVSPMSDDDAEVIEALISLGYSVIEAQRAVQSLSKEASGVEERLRLALVQMSQ
ncbi:MAG: Holliday junction branch migration protein RuvA [Chloroflexi bacterium]|nr:Holliday junction branch migration protein RuvA [Chloroflexota bacterium]